MHCALYLLCIVMHSVVHCSVRCSFVHNRFGYIVLFNIKGLFFRLNLANDGPNPFHSVTTRCMEQKISCPLKPSQKNSFNLQITLSQKTASLHKKPSLPQLERMQQYVIASAFVHMLYSVYLDKKPDISRCICSNTGRLGFLRRFRLFLTQ